MFAVFAGFGMGLTSTKFVAEFRLRDPEKAGRIILLSEAVAWTTGMLMAGVLYWIAPWLARQTLANPQLTEVLRIGSPLLLLTAINGAQTGALAGFESFKRIAHINLVSGAATFPLIVWGTIWGGLNGAVLGMVISTLVSCALAHNALRAEATKARVPLRIRGWAKEWGVLCQFSLPLLIANLMVGPINWATGAMLFNRPGGNAEMGALAAANQWFTALLFLPNLLGQSVLPMFSERLSVADHRRSLQLLKLSIGLNSFVVVPIVILGLASPLIMAWYGQEFRSDWTTLCFTLLTAGLLAIQMPVGQIIIASGKIWPGLLMNIGWALFYLSGAWLLIGHGAAGVAAARLAAYAVHASWTFWFALNILRQQRSSLIHD
jgi:O-antigen/teichoic acid export membrane protein